ncbi:MAG: hypothetical protein HYY76_02660 [Acidobacteria bacterium]|nr:hypothetical protein [Acidobacteriota bacterium]
MNSSAPEIEVAYTARRARLAGLIVQRVPARRAINSRASRRGPVDEIIITNVARPPLAYPATQHPTAQAPRHPIAQARWGPRPWGPRPQAPHGAGAVRTPRMLAVRDPRTRRRRRIYTS